jgi:hypothetical protein
MTPTARTGTERANEGSGVTERRAGYGAAVTDPRLEDHAVGVELQLTDLVERIERARVQGRLDDVAELQRQVDSLQDELAATAEAIAREHWPEAGIRS